MLNNRFMVVLAVVMFGIMAFSVDQAAAQSKRISGNSYFGCVDRQYFDKIIRYLVQKDRQAFYGGLADGISSGTCTMFIAGEEVFIADTAIFSGLVKVRRRGEIVEYWTNIEAVRLSK